jgi:hypothetical protein
VLSPRAQPFTERVMGLLQLFGWVPVEGIEFAPDEVDDVR